MLTSFHTHPQAAKHTQELSELDASETTNEIEAKVAFIVSTIGNGYDDYYHACEMYNSVFFSDETPEFTKALCRALINHFPDKTNMYWNKIVSE
jgi:hypothetical protein